MSESITRFYNNMPLPLQSAVIDAHIPERAKTNSDLLIQIESVIIGLFSEINPLIIIVKQDTGTLYCHVSHSYTQIIQDKITLLL